MLIPDAVRIPVYRDNLIAGLAMFMWGPVTLKIIFRIFVVIVGFLILSGRGEYLHYRVDWRADADRRRWGADGLVFASRTPALAQAFAL